MAIKKKKRHLDVTIYNSIMSENKLLPKALDALKDYFKFPLDSVLEIGTGTAKFLTKLLIEKERSKQIGKFYGMEPVDEFFEESKKHVVRLSHTDASIQEYYGGNPFGVITFSMVFGHILPDKKQKFLKNIFANLKDGGKLIVFDTFVPSYTNEEKRQISIDKFMQANLAYYKSKKHVALPTLIQDVIDDESEDFFFGNYKIDFKYFKEMLENAGFTKIKHELLQFDEKTEWKNMGYYIVKAEKP